MSLATEKPKKKRSSDDKDKPVIVKNVADLQRLKIEKLMKNPDKPVVIPDRPKEKNTPHVPEFVRNVMGSSAGAGSGEFHVYRHLRRKEYARQKFIQEKAAKESKEDEYHLKLEENKRKAEEVTAKKRAKRLKKKKSKRFKKTKEEVKPETESEENSDDDTTDEIIEPSRLDPNTNSDVLIPSNKSNSAEASDTLEQSEETSEQS